MNRWLQTVTDRVTTKKGMWWTLVVWFIVTVVLAVAAPSVKDYEVSSIESLPEDVQSMVAQKKIDQYFANSDGIPAIFVFRSDDEPISTEELQRLLADIEKNHQEALEQLVPIASLPPQAAARFLLKMGKSRLFQRFISLHWNRKKFARSMTIFRNSSIAKAM